MATGRGDRAGLPRRTSAADPVPDARHPTRTDGPPPLERLAPERLAGFLELGLSPADLLKLARKLAVNSPGYRLERLSAPELASLIADEYRDEAKSRHVTEEAILQSLKMPALRTLWITPPAARELAQLVSGDPVTAAARIAWRCIGDGDPAVRRAAERAIDAGLALLSDVDDAAERGPAQRPTPEKPVEPSPELERRIARAEKERESARALLEQARTEIGEKDKRIAALKADLAHQRVQVSESAAEVSQLEALVSTGARRDAHEQRRQAAEFAHLEQRAAELEEQLAAERRRSADMARALADEQKRERPPLNQPNELPPENDPAVAEFAIPLFSSEFYDSIEKWDKRIVKTAFEKALLLARDRRHPSLRALPLEGMDNYFRIRVATDVRLIYRREKSGRIEILSLIDREDLERYVRQAKTRPGS